jgi:hypothetical protein
MDEPLPLPFSTQDEPRISRLDGAVAAIQPRVAWLWCAVFAGVWMAGSWLAGWRVPVPGLDVFAAGVALVGAVMASVSGYVAIRSWSLRRR